MDERDMRERLRRLQDEHRALDAILNPDELVANDEATAVVGAGIGAFDAVGRMRAKKLKLRLRDEIAAIESMLIPDILA